MYSVHIVIACEPLSWLLVTVSVSYRKCIILVFNKLVPFFKMNYKANVTRSLWLRLEVGAIHIIHVSSYMSGVTKRFGVLFALLSVSIYFSSMNMIQLLIVLFFIEITAKVQDLLYAGEKKTIQCRISISLWPVISRLNVHVELILHDYLTIRLTIVDIETRHFFLQFVLTCMTKFNVTKDAYVYYFIAEAPSNPLLNFPFKCKAAHPWMFM